jgi:hypothetical protein
MTAFAKRTSAWGIASAALLVAAFVIDAYNGYLSHHREPPLFATLTGLRLCAAVQLAAAVCGVIAIIRGGSRWWSATVVPAILLALSCYFGEL